MNGLAVYRFRHHLHASPSQDDQWAILISVAAPSHARQLFGSVQVSNEGPISTELRFASSLDIQYANFLGAGGTPGEATWNDYGSPFTVVKGGAVTKVIDVMASHLAISISPADPVQPCHLIIDGWINSPVHITQNNLGDRNHYAMVVNNSTGDGSGGGGSVGGGIEVVSWPLSPLLSDSRGEVGAESYDPVNAILYKKVSVSPDTWWAVNAATE